MTVETWTAVIEQAVAEAELLPGPVTSPRDPAPVDPAVARLCRGTFTALRERLGESGVIAVVSPHRGEGRSTVAAALAECISRATEGPVLLLDLDLDRKDTPSFLGAMAEDGVLDGCRARFPWTVVDLPPILDIPDVARLTAQADGFVVVGRYRTTRVDALARVRRLLPAAAPIGFVMTACSSAVPSWIDRLL